MRSAVAAVVARPGQPSITTPFHDAHCGDLNSLSEVLVSSARGECARRATAMPTSADGGSRAVRLGVGLSDRARGVTGPDVTRISARARSVPGAPLRAPVRPWRALNEVRWRRKSFCPSQSVRWLTDWLSTVGKGPDGYRRAKAKGDPFDPQWVGGWIRR